MRPPVNLGGWWMDKEGMRENGGKMNNRANRHKSRAPSLQRQTKRNIKERTYRLSGHGWRKVQNFGCVDVSVHSNHGKLDHLEIDVKI